MSMTTMQVLLLGGPLAGSELSVACPPPPRLRLPWKAPASVRAWEPHEVFEFDEGGLVQRADDGGPLCRVAEYHLQSITDRVAVYRAAVGGES